MFSYLSIVFIMIVCTLVAGCITPNVDTPLGNNNVVIPGTIDNEAQKEFDHYMAIYDSKPSDYKIVSDTLTKYKIEGDSRSVLSFSAKQAGMLVTISSAKTFNIKNGVMLDIYGDTDYCFLIKDSSLKESYIVKFSILSTDGKVLDDRAWIAYVTPTDYNSIIELINEWFDEKSKK